MGCTSHPRTNDGTFKGGYRAQVLVGDYGDDKECRDAPYDTDQTRDDLSKRADLILDCPQGRTCYDEGADDVVTPYLSDSSIHTGA